MAFIGKSADDGNQHYAEAGEIHGVREGGELITMPPDGRTPIVLVAGTVEEFRSLVKQNEAPEKLQSILPRHSKISDAETDGAATVYAPRDGKISEPSLEQRPA